MIVQLSEVEQQDLHVRVFVLAPGVSLQFVKFLPHLANEGPGLFLPGEGRPLGESAGGPTTDHYL